MQITFLGATGTVTGSKYLVTCGGKKILVDCGLFQGYKTLRLRNWETLPISPKDIHTVLLTHTHIDHSGYLPLLIKQGFRGKIIATEGTKQLCAILLPDAGHLQEEEARLANKYGSSKHHPALPLYTAEEGKKTLDYFESVPYEKNISLFNNCDAQFIDAGHIIGAAMVKLQYENTSLVFSGDLGRPNDPVMRPPKPIEHTDYLVLESTYGDRLHNTETPMTKIGDIINQTFKKGGTLIIPAFAVGRTQSLLYYIHELKTAKMIPNIPVYLDSPMAIDATNLFCQFNNEHRLSLATCQAICSDAIYVNGTDESKQLDHDTHPKIIISASGMATGGRVLHHIKTYAPDAKNTILFAGYQAGGTRGDKMTKGEKTVKIFGEQVPIRARIESIDSASAHADYNEILHWLTHFANPPKSVFITHGETKAAASLKEKIEHAFNWKCVIPDYLETINLI